MSDEFFQDDHVKSVLLSRGKNKSKSICVSGEDIDGKHYKYTSEYLRWNLKALHVRCAHKYSENDRKQWFIDNPEPIVKFKEEQSMYKFLDNKFQTYLEDEVTKEVVIFNGTKDEAFVWLESQYGHAASFFTPVLCGE